MFLNNKFLGRFGFGLVAVSTIASCGVSFVNNESTSEVNRIISPEGDQRVVKAHSNIASFYNATSGNFCTVVFLDPKTALTATHCLPNKLLEEEGENEDPRKVAISKVFRDAYDNAGIDIKINHNGKLYDFIKRADFFSAGVSRITLETAVEGVVKLNIGELEAGDISVYTNSTEEATIKYMPSFIKEKYIEEQKGYFIHGSDTLAGASGGAILQNNKLVGIHLGY